MKVMILMVAVMLVGCSVDETSSTEQAVFPTCWWDAETLVCQSGRCTYQCTNDLCIGGCLSAPTEGGSDMTATYAGAEPAPELLPVCKFDDGASECCSGNCCTYCQDGLGCYTVCITSQAVGAPPAITTDPAPSLFPSCFFDEGWMVCCANTGESGECVVCNGGWSCYIW